MTDPSTYILYCEFVHCCGKTRLKLGQARTADQAEDWVRVQTRGRLRPSLPPQDLIRTCPVRHCPAKIQVPIYGYEAAVPA